MNSYVTAKELREAISRVADDAKIVISSRLMEDGIVTEIVSVADHEVTLWADDWDSFDEEDLAEWGEADSTEWTQEEYDAQIAETFSPEARAQAEQTMGGLLDMFGKMMETDGSPEALEELMRNFAPEAPAHKDEKG